MIEVVRAAIDLHPGASPSEASERIARLLSTVGEPESDFVAEHILAVLGLAELRTATEDIAWALRRFLAAVASGDLCVVVLEDLHWAEATLLDVIEHLAASARHTPLLLVGTARPELVERRPTWGAGRLDATNLALGPLGPEESDELVRNLLGRGDLAPDVRTRITEAAEGNPLFLEELLDMLVEEQLIRWDAGRWTAAGDLRETRSPSPSRPCWNPGLIASPRPSAPSWSGRRSSGGRSPRATSASSPPRSRPGRTSSPSRAGTSSCWSASGARTGASASGTT